MKRHVIALKEISQIVTIGCVDYPLNYPKGVSGVMYCFYDVESARRYYNNDSSDIELIDSETKKTLTI